MAEYIERRIAINEILTLRDYCFNDEEKHAFSLAYRKLRDAPTADVAEVKHGEWIYNTDDFTPGMRCSVCGYNKPIAAGESIVQEPNNFCNNCGADMRGQSNAD